MGKYIGSKQQELEELVRECEDYYKLMRTRRLLREIREGQNWPRDLIEIRRAS